MPVPPDTNSMFLGDRKPRALMLLHETNSNRYCSIMLFEVAGWTAAQYREESIRAIAALEGDWILIQYIEIKQADQYVAWESPS